MHRIKLNDRMTFPEELDMGPFIDVEDEVGDGEQWIPQPLSDLHKINPSSGFFFFFFGGFCLR